MGGRVHVDAQHSCHVHSTMLGLGVTQLCASRAAIAAVPHVLGLPAALPCPVDFCLQIK